MATLYAAKEGVVSNGALQLARNGCPLLGITPQYSLPDREVYISTAAHILKNAKSLHLLSDVLPGKAPDLPSWVPDWSSHNFDDESTVDTSTTRDEGQ
ncbi:hypothetical protein CDV31_009294 [Fusarium ambrosium]|uniref:Uncharacterized protein n=1 Tax=Fusarium ambrosium TaxID=131363 RepID=A0A428TVM3_9HYPO|nr:hypothetical protein CDV31_009294 [Fusarium ambrosium]